MQLPLALEEREDGFLYNEHGERLGTAEALDPTSLANAAQDSEQQDTSGIQQLAASEMLALQGTDTDAEAEDEEYQYYADDDDGTMDEPASKQVISSCP